MRILYIEDNVENGFLVKTALEKMDGTVVHIAYDIPAARSAWKKANQDDATYDVVLCDYHLGYSSGLVLIEEFSGQVPKTLFFGITSDDQKVGAFLNAGCKHVFIKPLRRNWEVDFFEKALDE